MTQLLIISPFSSDLWFEFFFVFFFLLPEMELVWCTPVCFLHISYSTRLALLFIYASLDTFFFLLPLYLITSYQSLPLTFFLDYTSRAHHLPFIREAYYILDLPIVLFAPKSLNCLYYYSNAEPRAISTSHNVSLYGFRIIFFVPYSPLDTGPS